MFIYLLIYFVNIGIYTVCCYPVCVHVLLLCTKTVQLINTLNIQKGRVKCPIDVSIEPHWHVHQKIWAVFVIFLFFYSTHLRIIVRRILLYCSKSFNQVPVSMSQSHYWQCLRQSQHLHCARMTWELNVEDFDSLLSILQMMWVIGNATLYFLLSISLSLSLYREKCWYF